MEEEDWRPVVDDLSFATITREEAVLAEQPFEEREILEALHSLNGDKASGPDGFSLAFFQTCWAVIKEDVIQCFNHFHVSEEFEKRLNATFIILIPKKLGEVAANDFRPIGLVGGCIN